MLGCWWRQSQPNCCFRGCASSYLSNQLSTLPCIGGRGSNRRRLCLRHHGDDPLSLDGGSLFADTVNAREEQQLPAHLLVIQSNGDAPYCIDTSATPVRGEVPIVCYESLNSVTTRVAGSFDEWFPTFFGHV
ncbi:SMI1/KNR4 family protein [Xanthomonas campestris pv. cannae]|nr:SMI1/KNR4 family protein [Xanthomonas campestris pv. cannae]